MQINWNAAIKAGLIAGLVFMALEMILVATIGGESPWAPPRMIAAIAMGKEVLPPPATFEPVSFIVAMLVHFGLSVVLAIVFALIAGSAGWSVAQATFAGLIFGLIVYAVNFYGMTAFFPWFAMARNLISILAHAIFGLVLGYSYRAMTSRAIVHSESV
jgi:uncharacterized membrane protein YagU involved in acid resistance